MIEKAQKAYHKHFENTFVKCVGLTPAGFSYASCPKAAFEKKCKNYHDLGESEKLDNKSHPDRPTGSGWKCP